MATDQAGHLRSITVKYQFRRLPNETYITTANLVESLRRALFANDTLSEIESISRPAPISGDQERILESSSVAKIRGQEFLLFTLSD